MSTKHFAVSTNKWPNIRGISKSSSISIITKSTRKVNWWTLIRTSSTTPYGLLIEWSASWSVILVEEIFRFPILRHIDKGIRLMLAPKSRRALPTDTSPIEHGMVTFLGSFEFLWWVLLDHNTAISFHHDALIIDIFPFLCEEVLQKFGIQRCLL